MKIKSLITIALLLFGVGHAFSLDTGYYLVKSYNDKYLTENTSNHTVLCSDQTSPTNYSQVWELTVNGTNVTLRNVLTQRYIYSVDSGSQFYTDTSVQNFIYGENSGVYTFHITHDYFGLHCNNNNNVVYYYISENKSKWTLESVTVDQDALAEQKAAIAEASTADLLKVFTTTACTELRSGYSESDLAALPTITQALAAKIKNNTWTTYDGWTSKTEKTFRIADYKAYSNHIRWTDIIGLGYRFGRLTNPTGISVSSGDYIQVYVGEIPSGQSVQLEVAGDYQSSGVTYTLKQGMNSLLMASSGNCFVQYDVDNTTDGKAPYTDISSYDPVTVHIEGGTVQGYFDLTKGDTNFDWSEMQHYLLKGTCVDLKTDNLVFHMQTSLVKSACPENMVELLGEWDKILDMEHSLMGLEEFNGYWNNMLTAVDMSGPNYMYATTYGTYYDVGTIPSIMSYAEMFAGGAIWGPAHENGHIFQKYINMVGQTEVSNNLFSNVAVFNNGHLTSRASLISTTFQNMSNNVYWNDREIWERTHMYFQLYQFFHILGRKSNFYPELFKALRSDPMTHTGNVFIPATDDYLKFYKKCCTVSGYDLTEFFQAYGFFVIPNLTSYTLSDVTKDAYMVEDYGNYYLTVTQEEIDAVKAEVAAMNLPKANIIFVEDRITAPDATYEGAAAGTKKTAFSSEYPIGQAGETGQYTIYDATCSAYRYNVRANIVTVEGTGAVGFKVYDSTGNLCGLYNTYTFTLPDGIGSGYTIKAAAGDGTDVSATFDSTIGVIVSDVTYVPYDTESLPDYTGKDISVSSNAAASLQTGQWYVMFDRGAYRGYLYENGENKLYNTNTVPSGSAADNAKYLVRIVGSENEYYLQTGLGNYFGKFQHSTVVPTTATATEQIIIRKIADTNEHFYLTSLEGTVLDANTTYYGDATVVGYGSTAPTATGGNNDWAFYPVEFTDSWQPTASEIYTINNTNTNRGALTYDPNANNKFVWSSGKGGAAAFDATNPNCQWIVVPTSTDGQYRLYNVGKQKFIVPTRSGSYGGYSWMFSSDAVAFKLVLQNDGTYKIKTAGDNICLSVSNNYTGPIINYDDVGAKFTITKQADASSEITSQLTNALMSIPAATKPLTLNVVGDNSYTTLYLDYDAQTDVNTKAYYVAETTSGYAQLTEVANEGRNIPAYTAVVLVNENAATNVNFSAGYSVSSGYAKTVDETSNLLKGTLVDMELDLSDNTTYYSLGKKSDKIGFYKFDKSGSSVIALGANKAYLDTPAASSARGFVFDVDNNTGISTMDDVRCKTDNIYDLSGRHVDSMKHGIYIINGKKIIK